MKKIKVEDAIGQIICHDMTRIVKGKMKGPQFKKGHLIQRDDIPLLLSMGKQHVYIWDNENDDDLIHENDAAAILRDICINDNMTALEVSEGKIKIMAACDGLFKVDVESLNRLNDLPDVMMATRHNNSPVKKGEILAATRAIPLFIEKEKLDAAVNITKETGRKISELLPYKALNAAIITTGSEVFHGRIKDTFTPVLIPKLENFGIEVTNHVYCDDDDYMLLDSIDKAHKSGTDIIICTGGMSVDPDDKTPGAIKKSGADIVTYGAPVLPGAMFLIGYFDDGTVIMGLPGGAMYVPATIFDILLPRIAAGDHINKSDIVKLGHGGLCLGCKVCSYPNCVFGKGH